jgi:hypothetical protein
MVENILGAHRGNGEGKVPVGSIEKINTTGTDHESCGGKSFEFNTIGNYS